MTLKTQFVFEHTVANFYGGIGLCTGLIGETSIQKIKANKRGAALLN
jgi:hypothetical protein